MSEVRFPLANFPFEMVLTESDDRYLLRCSYSRVGRKSQLRTLRERLQVLEYAIATQESGAYKHDDMQVAATLINASTLQEIDPPQIYPVESKWYMPELLRFYSESIALQSQRSGSFTQLDRLRNIWMTTALADACMFHATLYAASAYLDLLRGGSGNVITLYHQTETLRLLTGRLASSNLEVTDALIAVTMTLAQTEGLAGNTCVSNAHTAGLHEMVKIKGGLENLGMEGLLAELIFVGDIMESLLSGTEQAFPCTYTPAPPPMALLSNIISWETSTKSSARILGLVQHSMLSIDKLTSNPAKEQGEASLCFQRFKYLQEEFSLLCKGDTLELDADSPSTKTYVNECCRQAALLHWNLTNNKIFIPVADKPTIDVRGLKMTMEKMDITTWSRVAPRIFIWAGVTGVAASQDYGERAWFAARMGPVVMAQGHGGVPILIQGMRLYRWLKAPIMG
ncbi:hypothetical protein FQN49_002678 [Arthroderma sp. PD_2]|nr:hypothetical protein FQN49_002678 [Arthroderma sp. PD_2]